MVSVATRVHVDAEAYEAASSVIGVGVAETLADAGWAASDALAGCGAMAGSDPCGLAWAVAYDRGAASVCATASDVINAAFRLAALLQQCGFNYSRAELASVPGGTVPDGLDASDYALRVCALPHPPSASGAGVGPSTPNGWSLIEHAVGYVWPNGHQDRLHAAAAAWRMQAAAAHAAADYVPRAYAGIGDQDAPETDDAVIACRALQAHLTELAAAISALAQACDDYAGHLDDAHSAIEHELVELVAWSVAIEGAGALCAVATLGASEAAAQAAERTRIAATAARIAVIIEDFVALGRAAAELIANTAYRIDAISVELRPLLTARIVVALADGAEPVRIAEAGAATAGQRLAAGAAARVRLACIDDPKAFDPHLLHGMSFEDVQAAMPRTWVERPSKTGYGQVFEDPQRRGRYIRLMPGYNAGVRPVSINEGPYAVISQNGLKLKIPLAGNPVLP